jgi:outer membrane protein, heavy metal efflux system
MKQLIIVLISTIVFSSTLFSQNNIDRILTEIEKNNTLLLALRKNVEVDKVGNKTRIYLQNPEVEFNYLWSNPSVVGNRTDVSISQSFDFPTAYLFKNQISNLKNEQIDLEYKKQLKALLLQARLVCNDLVYTNALKSELSKRLIHAQSIANSYKSKYDAGDTNILEYNKAQLNLLNISKELESTEIERNTLLSELTSLNGGIFIDFTDSIFQSPIIPNDFEQWYVSVEQNNPVLSWLKKEMGISKKKEKLNRAMSLPKFQTGFMSEKIVGEQFQGITVGLSIPLWENKNTIKFAKANTLAIESIANDNKIQLYNHLKAMHTKSIGLNKNVNDYRLNFRLFDNSVLLKKALDKGEITLIEYMLELSIYYDSVKNLLDLELDLNNAMAELNQYN